LVTASGRDKATVMSQPYPANPVLLKLLEEGSFEHHGERYPTNYSTPSAICRQYGEMILERGFSAALEIGTLFGFSTLHLAEAIARNRGTLDTVDIRYEKRQWSNGAAILNVHEVAERLVAESNLQEVVNFHAGHSNEVLTRFIREGRSYDFALIDGSHVFPIVVLDFIFVDRLMRDGGVIALDDVGETMARKSPDGGPNRMLQMIFASGRYRITPLSANVVLCDKLNSL
jgi:predicted O-methyltransferase YrrM